MVLKGIWKFRQIRVLADGVLDIVSGGKLKLAGTEVTSTAAELNKLDGTTVTTAELTKLHGFTGVVADLNFAKDLNAVADVGATAVTLAERELIISGAATGIDHPINLNAITAMTGDETTDCGNIIKINRSGGAIGGTHSGIICKHYITGGAVDGTALVSGLYVNLKYQPDSENVAAEVSLMQTHLYSDASDAIDYGWYCLAPASKVSSLLGVSGTMTNFLEVKASGAAGMTVSADGMVKDPHTDNEAGYLTVKVENGASYQIPFYATV